MEYRTSRNPAQATTTIHTGNSFTAPAFWSFGSHEGESPSPRLRAFRSSFEIESVRTLIFSMPLRSAYFPLNPSARHRKYTSRTSSLRGSSAFRSPSSFV
jgi:hypothetical protein